MNPQRLSIVASLSLHALLFLFVAMMPAAKLLPVSRVIQISFSQEQSLSADTREVVQPAAAPMPVSQKRASRRDVEVEKTSPQAETSTNPPADRTVAVNLQSSAVRSTAEIEAKSPGKGPEITSAGPAVKQGIIETKFGTQGAPSFLHRELPVYPIMARRLGKEGRVVLKLLIDMKGKVQDIEIIEAAGFGFTEAAIEAIRKSSFTPAYRNGEKVAARAILPIRFNLE